MVALFLVACGSDQERTDRAVSAPSAAVTIVDASRTPAATIASTAPAVALPTPTSAEPLAAVVNGQPILLRDLERRVAQHTVALLEQGLDPDSPEGQSQLAQIGSDVLEGMIDYLLVEQAASALGITVADAELEAQVGADIAAGGGETAFQEWLQATGQTRDDYKDALRQSLLVERAVAAVTAGVSDRAEQVHARHILVDSRAAAEQVRERVLAGAGFAEVARELSQDDSTKGSGGDLGWFPRGLLAPELEAAAFGMQPGDVSDVVQLGQGYHVLYLVERDPDRPLSAEVQNQLILAVFDRWLLEQRNNAIVERPTTEPEP